MNPGRFYMPRYIGMTNRSIMSPMMRLTNPTPRGIGFFSRITNSIRSFNWGGLLNGASKTLNVVNQAIPLVRQAGPMVSNMKSMLKIAKAFGSETTSGNLSNRNKNIDNNKQKRINISNNSDNISFSQNSETELKINTDAPTFFI